MFYQYQAVVWSVRNQDFSRASLVLIYRRTDGLDIWFTFQQLDTKSKSSFFNGCSQRTCTGLHGRRVGWWPRRATFPSTTIRPRKPDNHPCDHNNHDDDSDDGDHNNEDDGSGDGDHNDLNQNDKNAEEYDQDQ